MRRFFFNVTVFSMVALPLHAVETNGEPGASVYDKHPECMERTDGIAANADCTVRNGPPIAIRSAPTVPPRQTANRK